MSIVRNKRWEKGMKGDPRKRNPTAEIWLWRMENNRRQRSPHGSGPPLPHTTWEPSPMFHTLYPKDKILDPFSHTHIYTFIHFPHEISNSCGTWSHLLSTRHCSTLIKFLYTLLQIWPSFSLFSTKTNFSLQKYFID